MGRLTIERVLAWEALDSRGTPTVACAVALAGGAEGQATVPSGASVGTHEAHELRDGGDRLSGKGVRNAVAAVNGEIAAAIRGRDAAAQADIDDLLRSLDGTPSLERLGANAVLAASVACAIAAAAAQGKPLWRCLAPEGPPLLPLPMVNVFSGGAHAGRLVDLQDVLVVPVGAPSFGKAIELAARVRAAAADELQARGLPVALVADEGGLAAPLGSNRDAIEVVAAAIERAGLVAGEEAAIAAIPKPKRRFHALRHAIAVHLLDAGADVESVQDRLGHANIQNTMVYMRYTTVTRDAQTRQLFASHRVV